MKENFIEEREEVKREPFSDLSEFTEIPNVEDLECGSISYNLPLGHLISSLEREQLSYLFIGVQLVCSLTCYARGSVR